jgi:hypothetical protein
MMVVVVVVVVVVVKKKKKLIFIDIPCIQSKEQPEDNRIMIELHK